MVLVMSKECREFSIVPIPAGTQSVIFVLLLWRRFS